MKIALGHLNDFIQVTLINRVKLAQLEGHCM